MIEITVDLEAYRANLLALDDRVAPAALMAVVKADGYGHGLLPIARAAVDAGIGWIGALDVPSALELRTAGIPGRIFAWLLAPDENYGSAIEASIDLGVSTVAQLDQIARAASGERARVHLKIDTGLHRNGATAEEWPSLVEHACELSASIDLVGAWTHISEASEEEDSRAITRFQEAISVASSLGANMDVRHLAASAAAYSRPDARFDLVRIGAFSYGISPGGGITPAELGIVPVMTLSAAVISSDEDTATVGIGYSDGVPSRASGAVSVAIAGVRYAVVDVQVDRMLVRVPPGAVAAGERCILFGPGTRGEATLQEWGDALGTIGEELVTKLRRDIPRTYLGA